MEMSQSVREAIEAGQIREWLSEQEPQLQSLLKRDKLRPRLEALTRIQSLSCMLLPSSPESTIESAVDDLPPPLKSSLATAANNFIGILLKKLFESQDQAEALAVVSLLTATCAARPSCLSFSLPAIVSRYEQLLNTANTWNSLQHSMKMSLASIMSNPSAEPYYPLLMDALAKVPRARHGGKREHAADDEEGGGQFNQGERKKASAFVDVTRIPLSVAIDIIVGSLQYVQVDSLNEVVERWRPTLAPSANPAPERIDPRRRDEPQQQTSQASRIDITGQSRPTLGLDELSDRVKQLLFRRLLLKGSSITKQFHRFAMYPIFIGRLLSNLDLFSLDLFDDLVDIVFPSEDTNTDIQLSPSDGCLIISAYLNTIFYTSADPSNYNEKLVKLLVMIPPEYMLPLCSSVPCLDYESLVPIVRQHLAPIGSSDDTSSHKIDPKNAALMMNLVGQIRDERPNDEWSLLRDLLVECCRSPDALLRSLAVEQAIKYVTVTDARSILYDDNEELTDGQRLDLPMAISQYSPEILADLLASYQSSAFFNARLFMLLPMLQNAACGPVYVQTWKDHLDFWIKLLGLKNAAVPASLFKIIADCFIEFPNGKIVHLILEKTPKDAVSDPASFLRASLAVVDLDTQMVKLMEFCASTFTPEETMKTLITMEYNERTMAAVQCCLSLAQLFKPPVLLATFSWFVSRQFRISVLMLRTALIALTLHKTSLTQPFLPLLSSCLATNFPWGDQSCLALLFKQIKIMLPHSLNILSGLPKDQISRALAANAEVDLRKPVKEYLYGLPPSVRSRYSLLLQYLE